MRRQHSIPNTTQMDPETFVFDNEKPGLKRLMTKLTSQVLDARERVEFLRDAGVKPDFITGIDPTRDPETLAITLSVRMKDYQVSLRDSHYHPLLCCIRAISDSPNRFGLDDRDLEFCRVLQDRIVENLNIIEARSAVCRVEAANGTPIGSGVYLGNRYVLTCGHVFKEARQTPVRVRFRYFREKDFYPDLFVYDTEPEPVSVSVHPNPDHALLCLQKDPLAVPARIEKESMGSGPDAVVRLMHYPGGGVLSISEPGKVLSRTDDYMLHSIASVKKISSGGPLFNQRWQLVGIHQGWAQDHELDDRISPNARVARAVPMDRLLEIPALKVVTDPQPIQ